MTIHPLDRSQLRARYVFTGALTLDTALHIGGGRESSTASDSPIIRDGSGRPLIPGSSFKGAFRAAVERMLPNLSPSFRTCQLIKIPKAQVADDSAKCLSVRDDLDEHYRQISEAVGRGSKLGTDNSAVQALGRDGREGWGKDVIPTESHLLDLLDEFLCDTCKVFGAPQLAAVARFHDLPIKGVWAETTQIRDGVGIDRDSERAIDQIKFDYEVVPAQTEFEFRLTLENPTDRDRALIALGLSEFINGMVALGGIRSRGLGSCHLGEVTVAAVNFEKPQELRDYMLKGLPVPKPLDGFLQQSMEPLLKAIGGNHA